MFHWRLFLITISLLLTTAGVSDLSRRYGTSGPQTDLSQTVFIATACLLFLSDKFNFDPEKVSMALYPSPPTRSSSAGSLKTEACNYPSPPLLYSYMAQRSAKEG